jgi:hypothetical protein
MKVLNLRCSAEHRFEGWFGSQADYLAQIEKNLVACPLCGDTQVQRLPSAPHVVTSHTRAASIAHESAGAHQAPSLRGADGVVEPHPSESSSRQTAHALQVDPQAVQAAWMQAVQHVIKHTDDVGPRFAEEARRMHYGEVEERPIRGQATPVEARSLREEGIDVASLPMPAAMKGPVQ